MWFTDRGPAQQRLRRPHQHERAIVVGQKMQLVPLATAADRFSGYVTGTTIVVDGDLALHNWIQLPVR